MSKNEIEVKYNNELNSLNLATYSKKELDFFFSLIYLTKEEGSKELTIPFDDLKKLAMVDKIDKDFYNQLENVNKKLIKLAHRIEIDNVIHIFSLFNVFSIDKNEQELRVEVNQLFAYMLNDLSEFTLFDLKHFVSLKSSYSKNIFKLLKQYQSVRERILSIEEFRELLNIPKSYGISEIDKKVLAPARAELPNFFNNLKVNKIKKGVKVIAFKFTWESNSKKIEAKKTNEAIDIIEISETLNNAIEKAKKNRFIKKLLTLHNIEKLLKTFAENDLVKGLNWAYREVRQDISSLNYLIKTIRTGIEKKEKKIVVKIAEEKIDTFDKYFEEIPLNFDKKELEKITRLDYEKLYQEYLETNKIKHNPFMRKTFDIANKNKYEIIESNDKNDDDNNDIPITLEEMSETSKKEYEDYKNKKEKKEEYMNKINEIAKDVRRYILEQQLEIKTLSSNIISKKINQKKINEYQEENEFLEQLVCEFGMWGVRLTSYTSFEELSEVEKNFNENIGETIEIFNLLYERKEIDKKLTVEFFKNMIVDCIDIKYSPVENLSHSELKKLFTLDDIPGEKLLSKHGKKLVGGALISRLEKIARDENIAIDYNGKIIA